MSIIGRSIDTITGMYDFAADGGAVGTINLQIPIPVNSIFMEAGSYTNVALTSGTSMATVSVDAFDMSTNPPTANVAFFQAAVLVSNAQYLKGGLKSFCDPSAPIFSGVPSFPISVAISIAVEPLLTGQLLFWFRVLTYEVSM